MTLTPTLQSTANIVLPSNPPSMNPYLSTFPLSATTVIIKYLTIFEVTNSNGDSIGVLLNGARMGDDNDVFLLTSTYDLYIINLSEDMHPMHIHLVNFQRYKEAPLDVIRYSADWQALNGGPPPYKPAVNQTVKPLVPNLPSNTYLTDQWVMLDGINRVWRDTDYVKPGYVSVLRFRFTMNDGTPFKGTTRLGKYVMHCHMLEHEDNEMMRYFTVQ